MTRTSRSGVEIGLVLSGGGARCFAHVGALMAVEEAGFRVVAIAANSTGAVLGALYAAGNDAAAVAGIARTIDLESFLSAGGPTGLIDHAGVRQLLAAHAPATFEELAIPFAVPTVDIERAEQLVFARGPLAPPVSASNAFPGLFEPVEHRGRMLMDGGILNNFPVDVIRAMTTAPVLAIDVRPSPRAPLELEPADASSLVGRVGAWLGRGPETTAELVTRAYAITQGRLVELTVALHPADVWLHPDLPDDLDIQDFTRRNEALDHGYRSTKAAIIAGELDALDGPTYG